MAKRSVRRRRQLKRRIFIGVFIFLSVFLAVSSIKYFSDDVYRSEAQFKEYVHAYFAGNGMDDVESTVAEGENIVYGKPLSLAMRYPKTGLEGPDQYIQGILKSSEEDFYEEYEDAETSDKIARFMNYRSYHTYENAVGIVMYQEDQLIIDGEMTTDNKAVYVYNYSTETGQRLSGINFFKRGYKAFFSEYLMNYFENISDKELKEGYEKYLTPKGHNLNDFVLTNAGVTFYFQPGTIMDESEGIVTVEINYADTGKIVRKEVVLDLIDPERPMVALTYDDGPYPDTSNRILDCLEKYGQIATFFEVGRNVNAYPEVTARKAKLGMEIGNHSWSHPNLLLLDKKDIEKQIDRTNDAIEEACGRTATVFRPPYGNTNKTVEKAADVPVILWSVDTLDWKYRNADKVFNSVRKVHNSGGLDGRVILMHSIYDSTAEATEKLVPWLLEEGYQLVTVSELIEYGYNEDPENGKLYGYGYFYK